MIMDFLNNQEVLMTNKKDIYKDEFGNYHEVNEEIEDKMDGFGDDEQDFDEDDLNNPFESRDDDDFYDEDEEYARELRSEYDIDED